MTKVPKVTIILEEANESKNSEIFVDYNQGNIFKGVRSLMRPNTPERLEEVYAHDEA